MMITEEVKHWCYRQCELQHATTESDISGMEQAWRYASIMWNSFGSIVDISDIVIMGNLIDPAANPNGRFRTGPAVFLSGGTSLPAHRIESVLSGFLSMLDDMTPEMAYRELMYIHPFKDGNGRMGALVYNILNGTIVNPVDPPEYK